MGLWTARLPPASSAAVRPLPRRMSPWGRLSWAIGVSSRSGWVLRRMGIEAPRLASTPPHGEVQAKGSQGRRRRDDGHGLDPGPGEDTTRNRPQSVAQIDEELALRGEAQ